GVQIEVVGRIGHAFVDPTAPGSGSGHGESDLGLVDWCVVRWFGGGTVGGNPLSVRVHDLDVEHDKVRAIGLQTVGPNCRGQLDGGRRPSGGQRVLADLRAAGVVPYGLDGARGESDVRPTVLIAVGCFAHLSL